MKRVLTAAAVAVVSALASVAVLRQSDIDAQTRAVINERPMESKAVVLPDGGPGYVWPATLASDGGRTLVLSEVAPCVRRPAGALANACRRRTEDGGARDFGGLNRFPVSEAIGTGCQPVACSVVFGEDSNNDAGSP